MQFSCGTTSHRHSKPPTTKTLYRLSTFKPTTTSNKMAFFPRYHTEASFTPLFRLLDDFDSYARQGQNVRNSRPAIAFQPKFDVRELENHFELHGELAGLNKENVHIEFTDPHTLRIHGRVERNYDSSPSPTAPVEEAQTNAEVDDNKSTTSSRSHQATVEDEDAEWTDGAEAPQTEVQKQPPQQPEPEKKQAAPRAKFWCTERSIGEFSRTFNFPGQVQQDAVSASLNNGILTIAIPKAPKHEARRIAIV